MAFIYAQNGYPIGFSQTTRRNSGFSSGGSVTHITAENGALKIVSPFNRQFVDRLKAEIPGTARKWEFQQKCWYVSTAYAKQIKTIIDECYGGDVQMPYVAAGNLEAFKITFVADYVANCKADAASVWCENGWNAKIPENILREFFGAKPENDGTFYGLLGCDQAATGEEIKRAYKRAARLWHPDLCRETNAREMFEQVKAAYDVLIVPESRNKYNAGLFFERIAKTGGQSNYKAVSFVPPMRCGKLTVTAKKDLGMLIVEKIHDWTDITNEIGQTMVSFWSDNQVSVLWV